MSAKSIGLSDALHAYVVSHSSPIDPVLRDLADETAALGGAAGMQIAPEQGTFLSLLARVLRPRYAVEVGTFTGYSAICVARELADGGRLLCCDVSEEWTAVARRYWTRAALDGRIELRLAPALETLQTLPREPAIDLSFIDADKGGYAAYWQELVPRTRPGGVLLVDNVLWRGSVVANGAGGADGADGAGGADPSGDESDDARAIRQFNDLAAADDRVDLVVLPIADGLTMAVKREAH